MQALLEVVFPVFIIVGYGYLAAWRKWVSETTIDGVMSFAQNFAVPLLLFSGISQINLGQNFHAPLLLSFYAGAFAGGAFAFLGARYIFKRSLTDCVAIGFIGLFSNSLLLGIPITERAYGTDALGWNFAIVSIHAPILYSVGIAFMEYAKAKGQGLSPAKLARQIARSVLRNPLVLGIAAGWIVNIGQIELPKFAWDAVGMMKSAAIPAALFGLGGVLVRYKPEGDMRVILWAITASLLVHPLITYGMGHFVFDLETGALRSATITAAMAPGVNTYIFADMYGAARRVVASSILIGTGLTVITGSAWILLVG